MSVATIGIVDYGVGNHASIVGVLSSLDYRCKVSRDQRALRESDVVVLPGVGAFGPAIAMLNETGLADFLRERAFNQRPIIGICLGMQLFSEASHEGGYACGLGLMPGEVVPLREFGPHIGWNNVENVRFDDLANSNDGEFFYFNHAYCFECRSDALVSIARHGRPVTAVVRRGNLVGMQFHPEKSQRTGRRFLNRVIKGLLDA